MKRKKQTEEKVAPTQFQLRGAGSGVGQAAKQPEVKSTTAAPKITAAVLRPADAAIFLGVSRTKLHFLHECDPTFPRKIVYSVRCVGFLKESLAAWLKAKERGAM